MPSFDINPVILATEDDLWALFKELAAGEWVGTVDYSADDPAAQVRTWKLHVMRADPVSPTGVTQLRASLGDVKVLIDGVFSTVMTVPAYEAVYGPIEEG